MLDSLQIVDFDLDIPEVLLVHKNTFVHLFKWNEYRTGRNVDGLVFCVSGRASFDFGSHKFEIKPGQVLFLPSSSSYTVRCESDEPFIHYTANFRINRTSSESNTYEQTAFSEILAGKLYHMTSPENGDIYSHPFERLLSVWQGKRNGYRVMAKALVYELTYLYFTDAGRSYRNKDEYNKLQPARHMLDNYYMQNQTAAELAALCGISESHFRRLFTRVFGMSPSEYRLNKRIDRAKDLLLSGQYNITETANEVGYPDPNYFTRIFRQRIGSSPRDFMKY